MLFYESRTIHNSDYAHIFMLDAEQAFPDATTNGEIWLREAEAWAEAVEWCRDQFGRASSYREKPRWSHDRPVIRFANGIWATAFKIRWC